MSNSVLEKTKNKGTQLIKKATNIVEKKKLLKNKKFIRIAVILLFSCIIVICYNNRHKLAPDQILGAIEDSFSSMGSGDGFPIKIAGNSVKSKNFKLLDKKIAYLSDTSFVCLNNSAKEIAHRQHSLSDPILKVNGNKALIYNLHGTGIKIESKSKNIYSHTTDHNILSAGVAQDGTFGVVTESNGFFGEMSIFSKNGKKTYYKYFFADHYITDMALSDNGMSACAVGFSAQNGGLVSSAYVFDYDKETPKIKVDYPDTMLLEVYYFSNGNIVVIGDNLVSFINLFTGKNINISYSSKNLAAFSINKNDGIAIALSSSEDCTDCEILVFNRKGKQEGTAIKTDKKITAISYNHNKIAALSYGNAFVYNLTGEILSKKEVGQDAKNIEFFSSNGLYILGLTEIRKIYF